MDFSSRHMEISSRDFENVIQQTGRGNIEVLQRFLEDGGDPNRRRIKGYRETLLIRAAYYGQIDCVELLLHHKADVSLGEADHILPTEPAHDYVFTGMNALAWAKSRNHGEVVELLNTQIFNDDIRPSGSAVSSQPSHTMQSSAFGSAPPSSVASPPLHVLHSSESDSSSTSSVAAPRTPSPLSASEPVPLIPSEVVARKVSLSYKLNANKALDKVHENKSLTEIVELPPSALQGLAEKADVELAKFHPPVKTIHELGDFKYFKLARAIKTLAAAEKRKRQGPSLQMNIHAFDEGYEVKSFKEMLKLPVNALRGVDGELVDVMRTGICGCGKIKNIKSLANYKYARWAEALSILSEYQTENFASKAPMAHSD